MERIEYYLLYDGDVQWFSFIVKVIDDKPTTWEQLPLGFVFQDSIFMQNITQRKAMKFPFDFNNSPAFGRSISNIEYDKIKKLIEIYPHYLKFNQILNNQ